jgi:OsmC-like protein
LPVQLISDVRSIRPKLTKVWATQARARVLVIFCLALLRLARRSPVRSAAMGIATERIGVTVDGDLDLRGRLGISKDVPVGFESIRLHFDVAAPNAIPERLRGLQEKTEQYCVVMQTLTRPPKLQTVWARHD